MGAEGERQRLEQEASPNHTVLIVEDEVFIRLMIADELRSAGYKVIEAATADEALDVLTCIAGVSVVISDIRMPGSMDGLQLARRVRSEYPPIHIVLTSGDLRNVDLIDHDGFFSKPYDVKKIIKHIKTLFDQKAPNSSAVVLGPLDCMSLHK
jgi:two-component system, response regulator PdtaR